MSGARIEVYAYRSGPDDADFAYTDWLLVDGDNARLSGPLPWTEALAAWCAAASAIVGATVAHDWDPVTHRLQLATSGTDFALNFPGRLAQYLGFSGPVSGANSYTADLPAGGRIDLVALDWSVPEDNADTDTLVLRHGRTRVNLFSNHALQRCKLLLLRSQLSENPGWFKAGRVRIFPAGADVPYSLENPGGYVDGYVLECAQPETLSDDGDLCEIAMTLAIAKDAL